MNFSTAFWLMLRKRPSKALTALYWHLVGKKVRARNKLHLALSQSPDAYRLWMTTIERSETEQAKHAYHLADFEYRPMFSIVLHQTEKLDQSDLDAHLAILEMQIYPAWELIVVPSPGAPSLKGYRHPRLRLQDRPTSDGWDSIRSASRDALGAYILFLPATATLPPTALYRYAEALQKTIRPHMLFGDHDELDSTGRRCTAWLKPKWNLELALAQDYLSQALVISTEITRLVVTEPCPETRAERYAVALYAATLPNTVVHHVAHIQAHLTAVHRQLNNIDRVPILHRYLAKAGFPKVTLEQSEHDTIRIDWPLPSILPLVSIIIPTKDKFHLLRSCISTLRANTEYPNFEIIVVDNGSTDSDAINYLNEVSRGNRIRVLRDARPYNFSQLNNGAVEEANGDYLCLLNNDTEVINKDWLTSMVRQAVRPHIGAVGAQLLYADGTIQHAGVTIGLGGAAGHAHRFQSPETFGYFARAHAAHYVSAVTAACLVVEKTKFLAVGGFDEKDFAIAFNDVDLCLKLEQARWRNVYTPYAVLLHHESKSRGKDHSPKHLKRYRKELRILQERWNTRFYIDPLHHERLERSSETYILRLDENSI